MNVLQYSAEQLAQLSRLGSLDTVMVSLANESRQDVVSCICQLTGLKGLKLLPVGPADEEGLLLHFPALYFPFKCVRDVREIYSVVNQ